MRKNSKSFQRIFRCIIILFIMFFGIFKINVFADGGDFGSDWSDSDWDTGYDYNYDYDYDYDYDRGSSWDDDYSYSSGSSRYYSSGMDIEGVIAFIIFIMIFLVILSIVNKDSKNNKFINPMYRNRNRYNNWNTNNSDMYNSMRNAYRKTNSPVYDNTLASLTPEKSKEVEKLILAIDESFSREEFESWVKQIFIKLQYAWTDRNSEEIRTFETKELFEQHNLQINKYIERKQINMLEQVSVYWVKLYSFYQIAERDVLEVAVNSRMIDYIIDEQTKEVVSGDNKIAKNRTYKLTFVRRKGLKTEPGPITLKAVNCPNCGGQLTMTQAGKCEYCGSIVVVDDHGWALSELEPFNK